MQPASPPTYDEFRARLRARQEVRTPSGGCPVAIALRVFRGRWKADLLYRLCAGPMGFGALLRSLSPEGLTRTMLAATLRDLAADGVVAPTERYEGRVRRVDWSLTPAGEDLLPVFYALMLWGTRHERP
jgi:DNA-binding HxlR family transcriptional regulator